MANTELQSYLAGLEAAISQASGYIKNGLTLQASQAEAVGRAMTDLAADYSRGIMQMAERTSLSVAEQTILREAGEGLLTKIENIRQSGTDAFEQMGRATAEGQRGQVLQPK